MHLAILVMMMFLPLLPPQISEDPVIIVNKATHELSVFEKGKEIFNTSAAIGRTTELTPEGQFHIKVKAKDPYYRKKNIPGGTPENPLGTRWIGFDARGTDGRIYGIHGTNRPDSIGRSVSAGCIRLQNKDVEKLFDLISIESEVVIVKSSSEMESLYESWVRDGLNRILNPAT
ncbi:L,D-transpeptidase [Halobacillus sp. K22]|uniref:L,D-transpeptidase n=1 Tax=Halobacillus sp. K22 TaxID=3457431 RepID=UPI003FCDA051